MASSMVKMGCEFFHQHLGFFGGFAGVQHVTRATTTATAWPTNSTLLTAKNGSSWLMGPQLFSPGRPRQV
jgi:hypothetical protein